MLSGQFQHSQQDHISQSVQPSGRAEATACGLSDLSRGSTNGPIAAAAALVFDVTCHLKWRLTAGLKEFPQHVIV